MSFTQIGTLCDKHTLVESRELFREVGMLAAFDRLIVFDNSVYLNPSLALLCVHGLKPGQIRHRSRSFSRSLV